MTVMSVREDQAAPSAPQAVTIPPQGGYVAKQCPRRAHNDFDLEQEGRRDDDPESLRARLVEGQEFEHEIGNALASYNKPIHVSRRKRLLTIAKDGRSRVPTRIKRLAEELSGADMVMVPACDRSVASKRLREVITLAAMDARVGFIWNARLVADKVASRISEPDFLVLDPEESESVGRPVYVPGDVKHHRTFDGTVAKRDRLVGSLEHPLFRDSHLASVGPGQLHSGDTVQLAHYHRHLEALGYSSRNPRGIVIGKERQLVWDNLDEPVYLHRDDNGRRRMGALEIYDHEFAKRLAIIERSIVRNDDPNLEPLVVPEWKSECLECPWRSQCHDVLDAAHHITLLQGITPERARAHYQVGVRDYYRLSGMHVPTAMLVDLKIDAPAVIAQARAWNDQDAPASAVLSANVKPGELPEVLRHLETVGTVTVSDLSALHDTTARYAGTGVHRLVEKIDRARVKRRNRVFRARGVSDVPLPTPTTMGLHFDVENDGDHMYLVGVWVVGRESSSNKSKVKTDFHAFVTWDGTEDGEAKIFAEFWEFLQSWIVRAKSMKWGLKAYHYAAHERTVFRNLAIRYAGRKGIPTVEDVEALFASDTIVDLQKVLVESLIWPTESTSLKALAKQAGFSWRDEDPSGGNSIAWYRAVMAEKDPDKVQELRQRILDYNEDDVQATARLVEFINRISAEARKPGSKLPPVEDLDRRYGPRVRNQ